jgi:hypothetical protein
MSPTIPASDTIAFSDTTGLDKSIAKWALLHPPGTADFCDPSGSNLSRYFGLSDIANGMNQFRGYSVGIDPSGDQIVGDYASDGKIPADAKSYSGKFTVTTGTGKYAGISGGGTFTCHSPDFGTAAEGTYAQ